MLDVHQYKTNQDTKRRLSYPRAAGYTNRYTVWYLVTRVGVVLLGFFTFPVLLVFWGGISEGVLLFLTVFGMLAGAFVLMVVIAFILTWDRRQRGKELARELDHRGEICQGVIIDRWRNHGDHNRSDFQHYHVAYRYDKQEIRQEVGALTYWRLSLGKAARVRYLPDNPEAARLEDYR